MNKYSSSDKKPNTQKGFFIRLTENSGGYMIVHPNGTSKTVKRLSHIGFPNKATGNSQAASAKEATENRNKRVKRLLKTYGLEVRPVDRPLVAAGRTLATQSQVDKEPTTEELSAITAALDTARDTAQRVIGMMDRVHHLMEDSIREVREARDVARWSNDFALARSHEAASK